MENFSTIYDMLETMQYKDGNGVGKLKEDAEAGKSGYLTYYNNDKVRLFYYQASEYNDWTSRERDAHGTEQVVRCLPLYRCG